MTSFFEAKRQKSHTKTELELKDTAPSILALLMSRWHGFDIKFFYGWCDAIVVCSQTATTPGMSYYVLVE